MHSFGSYETSQHLGKCSSDLAMARRRDEEMIYSITSLFQKVPDGALTEKETLAACQHKLDEMYTYNRENNGLKKGNKNQGFFSKLKKIENGITTAQN